MLVYETNKTVAKSCLNSKDKNDFRYDSIYLLINVAACYNYKVVMVL